MSDRMKTLWIGVFIIAAIVAIASLLLFLEPTIGDEGKTLRVRFSNIEKISIGTRVTFAGKPVGEVVQINEIFDARSQPADSLGNIYFYELVLKVDSSVDVYNSDLIIFQTSGLLGEKSIAIIPKAPKPGSPPAHIVTDEVLYARSTDKIEEAINEVISISGKINQAVDRVVVFFDSNSSEMHSTIQSIHKTSDEIGDFFARSNESDLPSSLCQAIDAFKQTMGNANAMIDDIHESSLIPHIDNVVAHLDSITCALDQPETMNEILQNLKDMTCDVCTVFNCIANGTGTLGRLINSDELYLKLNSAFGGVETLLCDVKTYGLLFNYNKRWQRRQTQEQALMQSLARSDNFYSYFNQELTQIHQSLNEVSCLMQTQERAGKQAGNDCSLSCSNEEFMTQFYALLKKVDEMQATLKLYNQAIVQQCD